MSVAWSELTYACDPGVGQEIVTVSPALSLTFYVRVPDLAAVTQLYESVLALIGPGLTHYRADGMKRPEPITQRALGMIPTWMRKPKLTHRYGWEANGGSDLGCAPPGFELDVMPLPPLTPAQKERSLANALKSSGPGELFNYLLGSQMRLVLPVDHPLSEAGAMREWLLGLALVKAGAVSFATCGYGLSSLAAAFGGETERRERALCSRYPGLDCFRSWHAQNMYLVDPAIPDFVPLVKRASWTMILHDLTVDYLGGEAQVRERLAGSSAIIVTPFEHGLVVQAGERPQLGDLNTGDDLPLIRQVARVVQPVRVKRPAEKSEFWEHFFDMFDKSFA
jgi:hypothetical protein